MVDLITRRKARLNRPTHDCCYCTSKYLKLRFWGDKWAFVLNLGGNEQREINVFYCPWCGQDLVKHGTDNS